MSEQSYTKYRIRRRRRVWRAFAVGLVLVVGGLVGSGAWLARADTGRLPPDVEIAGVDVGGLTVAEARTRLEQASADRVAAPIALVYDGEALETSGVELGVQPTIDQALEQALDSRSRFSRLKARLGLTDPVSIPLAYESDPRRVREVLGRVQEEIERGPRAARVALKDGQIVVRPARIGLVLDVEAAAAALETLPETVELSVEEVVPAVTDEEAEAARATAEALLAQPPLVTHRRTRVELGADLLREALRFRRADGTITVELDPEVLAPRLERRFRRHEQQPKDAAFRIRGERVVVVRAKPGRLLSVEKVAEAIVLAAGARIVPAVFEDAEADLTTAEARKLGIRRLVSEFTTPYSCCPPRVTNIKLAARILDGQIIPAGGRFSLNEAMGERTSARGFVAAPMISAGRLVDAVGGGVSQVATTFYNAAFFAGLELIQATPHEFYISRYPMGREATVSWGGPELIFRNDWSAAILVKVVATDTSITVRFYSSKLGRRVETQTFEPYAYTSAKTIRVLNRDLPPGTEQVVQSGGISGFTVEYTRKVYRGKRLLRDERFAVRYRPENTIVEHGPDRPQGDGAGAGAGSGSGGGGSGGSGGGSGGSGSGGSSGGGAEVGGSASISTGELPCGREPGRRNGRCTAGPSSGCESR